MNEGNFDSHAQFDPDLFTPEELAMMNGADGVTNEMAVNHDAAELQAQYVAVAKLVAEGGERERCLRAVVNDLTILANASQKQHSIYEQTQNLARIVLASSERELQLQKSLEALRAVVVARADKAS